MKKLTILTAAFVLMWAGVGWTATFGYNTGGGTGDDFDADSTFASKGGTTAGLNYTAVSGDHLDSIRVYVTRNGGAQDSIAVLLYTMSGGEPATRVVVDTVVTTSAGPEWLAAATPYDMTAGVTYCLAVSTINDAFTLIMKDAGSTNDGIHTTAKAPSPWGGTTANVSLWYSIVGVYSNTAPSPSLSIGGGTVIGGNVVIGGK